MYTDKQTILILNFYSHRELFRAKNAMNMFLDSARLVRYYEMYKPATYNDLLLASLCPKENLDSGPLELIITF